MKKLFAKITMFTAMLMGAMMFAAPLAVVHADTDCTGLGPLQCQAKKAAEAATAAAPDPNKKAICDGLEITGGSCTETKGPSVEGTVKLVVNILSLVVGIAAVVMIIIGGFKYIISSGDSSNINSAKNTILYAIIGLVIVALAQVIVRYVLVQVSKEPLPTCSTTVTTNCTTP